MHLTFTGTRFELYVPWGERHLLGESSGFRWDKRKKRWWTQLAALAFPYEAHADQTAAVAIRQARNNIQYSRMLEFKTPVLSVPVPTGLSYLPFQIPGILFGLNRENTLNADEPGLGKTIQAAGHINANRNIKRVAVCTKASLKINWERELRKWLTRDLSIGVASTKLWPGTDIVIFNYEASLELAEELDNVHWHLLVLDESHFLKNPEAKRTQCLIGKEEHRKLVVPPLPADQRLFLTGTPIDRRPRDLWTQTRLIDPQGLGASRSFFETRYCNAHMTPFGWDDTGASNTDELQEVMRSRFMVRRLKRDCMPYLPRKRRQIIPITAPQAAEALIQREFRFYDSHEGEIAAIRHHIEMEQHVGDDYSFKQAGSTLRDQLKLDFGEVSSLRHQLALTKLPTMVGFIEDILEETDKLAVFAHHQDVIAALHTRFPNSVTHYGKNRDNQASVDRFQDDPACNLFIGAITGAVGYTITATARILFVEFDWRASVVEQAEDRPHRIGQNEALLIQYLVYNNSIEARQIKSIIDQLETNDRALNAQL